jgi:hypothetical protein
VIKSAAWRRRGRPNFAGSCLAAGPRDRRAAGRLPTDHYRHITDLRSFLLRAAEVGVPEVNDPPAEQAELGEGHAVVEAMVKFMR